MTVLVVRDPESGAILRLAVNCSHPQSTFYDGAPRSTQSFDNSINLAEALANVFDQLDAHLFEHTQTIHRAGTSTCLQIAINIVRSKIKVKKQMLMSELPQRLLAYPPS